MLALIGDIHGCLGPLEEIVNAALQRTSILVFLGDYVNRGPDSSEVVEFLVSLQGEKQIETHFLEGNHDVEFHWDEVKDDFRAILSAYRAARTHLVIHVRGDGAEARFCTWEDTGPQPVRSS